jgi:archaellum component FlaF (FlaF/FlaG flagellin family)
VKELCLAYVYVEGNAKNIKQKNVEDMRGSSLCPWVTGLIQQVDTSTLFSQFESAYNELYESWANQFDKLIKDKQTEYEKWFSTLEQGLDINLRLKTYQNIVQTTSTVNELTLGIAQYLSGDIVQISSNGLLLTEDLDYTISGEGASAKVKLLNGLESGNTITFTVIKGTSAS